MLNKGITTASQSLLLFYLGIEREICWNRILHSISSRCLTSVKNYLHKKKLLKNTHTYTNTCSHVRCWKLNRKLTGISYLSFMYSLCLSSFYLIDNYYKRWKQWTERKRWEIKRPLHLTSSYCWLKCEGKRVGILLNTIFRLNFFLVFSGFRSGGFWPSLFFRRATFFHFSLYPSFSILTVSERAGERLFVPVKYHFVFSRLTLRKFICEWDNTVVD